MLRKRTKTVVIAAAAFSLIGAALLTWYLTRKDDVIEAHDRRPSRSWNFLARGPPKKVIVYLNNVSITM